MNDDEIAVRVARYVRSRVRDAHLAEDLTQDVLLKLHARRESLPKDPHRVLAWSIQTARNTIIDHHRRNRERTVSIDLAEPIEAKVHDASRDLSVCAARMLRYLPLAYREPVELFDLKQRPQRQIARQLGLSISGVKSRVRRGRRQLAALIADCCDIDISIDGGIQGFEPRPRARALCGDQNADSSCVQQAADASSL